MKKITKEFQILDTIFKDNMDEKHPWQEYPRPNLVRDSYINLNGLWDYRISKEEQITSNYDGKILVPFPIESKLSNVQVELEEGDYLFYHTEIVIDKSFIKDIVYLNFQAVDQIADIYINGEFVHHNEGGYIPFSINITKYIKTNGINTIDVRVLDNLDQKYPYGKQSRKRGGIWYTPTSGIWQTVWLESVYSNYVKDIKITPNIDNSEIEIELLNETIPGIKKTISIIYENTIINKVSFTGNKEVIKIDDLHLWSPEEPNLYNFDLIYDKDKVSSYFAMRKFSIGDLNNKKVFMLNNKPYFHNGLLDQGYFSDGIYLPATVEGYINDILEMKELGFNTLRKHIKVEPLIWYYLCDKFGMIVWQDMVNNSNYSFVKETMLPFIGIKKISDRNKKNPSAHKNEFIREMKQTINLLYNFPCISLWTIFNEGWGQFNSIEMYKLVKEMDSTRFIDATSGWFDQGENELTSLHIYMKKIKLKEDKRVQTISEFGGYTYKIDEHSFNLNKTYGYKTINSLEDLNNDFIRLYEEEIIPYISEGLSACIYTQVSDVEDETNGILTYDRKICKLDKERISQLNKKVRF